MNKMILYLEGRELYIKVLTVTDAGKEVNLVSGKAISTYIDRISNFKLNNIRNAENINDIILDYDNFSLKINNYQEVFKIPSMQRIKNSIKKLEEKENLKKNPNKRVTRKNKHTNKKIIATGLALLVIASSFSVASLTKDENKDVTSSYEIVFNENDAPNTTTIKIVDEDNESDNEATKEDNTQDNQEENDEKYSSIVSIDYNDRSNTDKANYTRTNYDELINKYSKMYGLDPKLITAIATQERGVHSSTMDKGGATGLMQIQNSVWIGHKITAYNFDMKKNETIVVDEENISNVSTNIKIGCMIFQNTLKSMRYNILAGIQCYNMGYGNMKKILLEYSSETGKGVNEILDDELDSGWLNNRDLIRVGDQKYIEHVLSWIGEDVNINIQKSDGSLVSLSVNNKDVVSKVNK